MVIQRLNLTVDHDTCLEKFAHATTFLLTYLIAVFNLNGFLVTPQHPYAISGGRRQQLSNYVTSALLCHFPRSRSISSSVCSGPRSIDSVN